MGLAGLGVLALWAVFVAVVRVLDVPVGGIQPEAFALTAMMTAPFTLGAVLLMTLGTAGLEALVAASGRRAADQFHVRRYRRALDSSGRVDPTGWRHRFIKGWHFRYEVLNANAFRITAMYYSSFNPRHPIFGQDVDLP